MLVIIYAFKLLRGVKKIEYKMNIYIQSNENTKIRKNGKTKKRKCHLSQNSFTMCCLQVTNTTSMSRMV